MGELIDTASILTTVGGVCTSLGMGATTINGGLSELTNGKIEINVRNKVIIIWAITLVATISTTTGLK